MNGVELKIWEQRERDKQSNGLRELLRDLPSILEVIVYQIVAQADADIANDAAFDF